MCFEEKWPMFVVDDSIFGGTDDCPTLQESLVGGVVFQVGQTAFSYQKSSRYQRETGQYSGLARRYHY